MNRFTTALRLLGLLVPLRGVLTLSIGMRLLNHTLGAGLLVLAAWGLARITEAGTLDGLFWPFGAMLVGIGFVKGLCRYLEQFTGHYVAFRLLCSLRVRLFHKLAALAPAGLGRDRSGDLLTRVISDIERIEIFYAHTIAPAVVAFVVPALAVAALGFLSPWMAVVTLPLLVVVGIGLPWGAQRIARRFTMKSRAGLADLGACFTDGVLGLRDVLALGAAPLRLAEIDGAGALLARAQRGLTWCGAGQMAGTDLLIGAATLLAVGCGAALSFTGFSVAIVLVMSAFVPLLGISNLIPDLEQALESARRLFAVLDRPEPCEEATSLMGDALPADEGVRFEGVKFSYSDDTVVLSGLNLEIHPGELVAVVGESGAGKSTLAHLLLRFWEPAAGRITVQGHDVRAMTAAKLREVFAVVSQRSHVFQASVRENLRIGKEDAGDEELREAMRLAGLEKEIAKWPDGFDTDAGVLGGRLSGGQRQRLAAARAFLKPASILVFDEATSHLDAECERDIQSGIRAWMRAGARRSTLVISHRLDSVREADRIYVIEAGRVAESGTHAELACAGGAYARLFRLEA